MEDALAAFSDQRAELAIQVLMLRGDARIADFSHAPPATFETDFLTTEMVGFLGTFVTKGKPPRTVLLTVLTIMPRLKTPAHVAIQAHAILLDIKEQQ